MKESGESPIDTRSVLRAWLGGLSKEDAARARSLWEACLRAVRTNKTDDAQRLIEGANLGFPLSARVIVSIAQQEVETANRTFWESPEVAGDYHAGAAVDDGTLEVLDQLMVDHQIDLHLSPRAKVADIGSGTGLVLSHFLPYLPNDAEVVGCDISAAMNGRNILRERYKDLVVQDLSDGLPEAWKSQTFEFILAAGVFQYLNPDALRRIIQDAVSHLAKEGKLVFSVGRFSESDGWADHSPITDTKGENCGTIMTNLGAPMYFYKPEYIERLLDENELTVEASRAYNLSKRGKGPEESQPSMFMVVKKQSRSSSGF